jgi:type II secretion system protein G
MVSKRISSQRAFTLIELLVVILIIGILIAVAAPSFLGQQDKARDSAVKQDLTVIRKELKAEWTDEQAYPSTTAELITALEKAEPQYTYAAFDSTNPSAITPVRGTAYLDRVAADSTVACQQSGSSRFFCLMTSEEQGIQTLASLESDVAYAASNTQTRYSSGATLVDAVAALDGTGGVAGTGTGGSGVPRWGGATTAAAPAPSNETASAVLTVNAGALTESYTQAVTYNWNLSLPSGATEPRIAFDLAINEGNDPIDTTPSNFVNSYQNFATSYDDIATSGYFAPAYYGAFTSYPDKTYLQEGASGSYTPTGYPDGLPVVSNTTALFIRYWYSYKNSGGTTVTGTSNVVKIILDGTHSAEASSL